MKRDITIVHAYIQWRSSHLAVLALRQERQAARGGKMRLHSAHSTRILKKWSENVSNENPDNNAELQRNTENISLSAETQETGSIKSNTNEINYALPVIDGDEGENNDEAVAVVNNLPNDVASWPEVIDHHLYG
ncbi:unnamed protein product [Clavelina lepadiformis]|uniref:Uncharacterized protein n=1 Tax=Clavelina lepadiformis TaxID=159417 RepID=A0ABP0GRD7_CLALP